MTLLRLIGIGGVAACLCLPFSAQQPAPPAESSGQSSSSKAAPVQDDQQPPADQSAPSTTNSSATKHDSKLKKKLKDAAPSCIGFEGGAGKCRHSKGSEEDQKKEMEERQLRQQCQDAADAGRTEGQSCADLRKRDAVHDVSVGDDYLADKHYPSAVNRYKLALQEDPTNSTAMLHLAQTLEKTGQNSAAYEQYQNFLNTDPQGPDAKLARQALDRLRPYWTGTPASK